MIGILDNYDSFTFNLVQAIGERLLARGRDPAALIRVWRSDAVALAELDAANLTHLLISPGPGRPSESGISAAAMHHFAGRAAVLGVCLGHQCMAEMQGAVVERAARILHGKTSRIHHDGRTIFRGLPDGFEATRYHSLIVRRDSLPAEFEISAWTDEGEIMGLRRRDGTMEGVQFHPESYLCTHGGQLLDNFLSQGAGA